MIARGIGFAVRHRIGVAVAFAAACGLGLAVLPQITLDAVPDITNVQVVVTTMTGALDPEQIERAVTFPIETGLRGIERIRDVRSLSKYGLSHVTVVFDDGTDIYWARQQVSERLPGLTAGLPDGVVPHLAPISTGLGEVFMYAVTARAGSSLAARPEADRLTHLRTLHDFVVAPHLKRSVRGVAEIDVNGGYARRIHVDVDLARCAAEGLTPEDVARALSTVGENFGGGAIERDGRRILVHASGRLDSFDAIRSLPVRVDVSGRPVPLSRVAAVREGHVERVGAATLAGEETVLGIVLMLAGANAHQVSRDVASALASAPVPEEVSIVPLYSRARLVDAVLATVATNLAEGAALVVAVLLLFLGSVRAAFLVALAIPVSMLCAGIGMRFFGISANLMSLGAVDFGLLVDASVVVIENAHRRLARSGGGGGLRERLAVVGEAASEVARPVALGLFVIMLVYVPVLSLGGIEGKLFLPMAQVVLMALVASLATGLLLMPALAALALRGAASGARPPLAARVVAAAYAPLLALVVARPLLAVAAAAALVLAGAAAYVRVGAEFMPPLDEGDLVVNLTHRSDISLGESVRWQKLADRAIAAFPEVRAVYSRIGTPETATDPMGIHLSDTFVILESDRSRWTRVGGRPRTKGQLYEAIRAAIAAKVPDAEISENQPIEMRFNEILEGSRADVALRIYGSNLEVLADAIETARDALEKVPGASEVELDGLTALRRGPVLQIRPLPKEAARVGLALSDVNRALELSMGGREVGSFYEGPWRFPIVLRAAEAQRGDPSWLPRVPVPLPDGGSVPLGQLAKLEMREIVTTIAHEEGRRYAGVAINLSDRDVEGFVGRARAALAEKLRLPEGYEVKWAGQFEHLARARSRLLLVAGAVLVAILAVLWAALGRLRLALLVYSAVPIAVTGGLVALYLRGIPLSVSAGIGIIATAGIAILNGMVLVSVFEQLRREGRTARQAAQEGAALRLRPVVTTALVASLGFVPMALNTGLGAEVQRPLATVVIGGVVTATLITLLIVPALYAWIAGGFRAADGRS